MKAHSGHAGSGGLQKHSIGPIYPWMIVASPCDYKGHRFGTVKAVHALTNEECPAHEYDFKAAESGTPYNRAYALATQDAERKLQA